MPRIKPSDLFAEAGPDLGPQRRLHLCGQSLYGDLGVAQNWSWTPEKWLSFHQVGSRFPKIGSEVLVGFLVETLEKRRRNACPRIGGLAMLGPFHLHHIHSGPDLITHGSPLQIPCVCVTLAVRVDASCT